MRDLIELIKARRAQQRPSKAPGGYGHITRYGYRMIRINKKSTFEHRLVWEHFNGPILEGMHIHHKDENRFNNDISNLELVDNETHRRIHSGLYKKNDDEWLKICRACGKTFSLSAFYGNSRKRLTAECRPCYCIKTMSQRRLRNVQA